MLIREVATNLFSINANDIRANGATLEQAAQLHACFMQSGALIIEDVFSVDYIDHLKNHFDTRYGVLTEAQLEQHYYKVGLKRYQITMEMVPPFNDPIIYADPVILAINKILLGEKIALDSYVAVLSLSGSAAQQAHRDNPGLFGDEVLSGMLPAYAMTMIIPLVDINMENGSTALWPGSHKNCVANYTVVDEPALPIIKRGSAYLWDYRLVHAGAPNNSAQGRPLLALVYSKPWFSDSINARREPPIYLSRSQYESIPDEAKYLFDKFLWNIK